MLWGENAPGLFMSLGEAMVPRLRDLGAGLGYRWQQINSPPVLLILSFYYNHMGVCL